MKGADMPAAKPSKGSIGNAIKAIISAGLQPGAIQVGGDGTFRVEILGAGTVATGSRDSSAANSVALQWEDVA